MSAVLIAILAFFAYLLAYHSYGRRLATRLLGLDATRRPRSPWRAATAPAPQTG